MRIESKLAYITERLDRIENIDRCLNEVVEKNAHELLELNRDQMLLGRNSSGDPFTPDYLSDSYFKTPVAAKAYADMKYRLESVHRARIRLPLNWPDKDKNTPNLIVTGQFQDGMYIRVAQGSFTIDSTYVDSRDIEAKYNGQVFGLAPLAKEFWWDYRLREELRRYINMI